MTAIQARHAPPLDPRAVARWRQGRAPADWQSCGWCRQCGHQDRCALSDA